MISFVANCGSGIGWRGNIDHDLPHEVPILIEYLDATITPVRDIYIVLCVYSDAVWSVELAGLAPRCTPRLLPIAILI